MERPKRRPKEEREEIKPKEEQEEISPYAAAAIIDDIFSEKAKEYFEKKGIKKDDLQNIEEWLKGYKKDGVLPLRVFVESVINHPPRVDKEFISTLLPLASALSDALTYIKETMEEYALKKAEEQTKTQKDISKLLLLKKLKERNIYREVIYFWIDSLSRFIGGYQEKVNRQKDSENQNG